MGKIKIHEEIARLKDVDIFYRDTKSKGPAILCLHGRYGRGETWTDFIQHFGEEYRVIAPDQNVHLGDKEKFYSYFDDWLKGL